METPGEQPPSYLRRLHPEAYRGCAFAHWSMTLQDRRRGWLNEKFHAQFRELLAHSGGRHGIACPLYCLMPDHFHLLWIGFQPDSDQRLAARFLRTHVNEALKELGPGTFHLQKQAHDNVLREQDRERDAFVNVAAYIRANPLRAGLVADEEALPDYPFSGALVPGYPRLSIWAAEFWDDFWKIYYQLVEKHRDL